MINNLFKRALSVILSVTIAIPLFSLDTAFAKSHPVSSIRIYLDPILGAGQTSIEDTAEMTEEAMSEPSYYDQIDLNRSHP